MRFAKWQGLGNDYLVLPAEELAEELTPRMVRAVCDRHFGVGADGILVVGRGDHADARMVIHNPDGSQAEMCGNGIRMAALWLAATGRVVPDANGRFAIETAGGVMRPQLLDAEHVRVDMGQVRTDGLETLQLPDGSSWQGRIVDVGNPHFVVQHDPGDIALELVGRALEHHERFPQRTNVEFARAESGSHVRMRVWERGVGETLACGTGACAVGVAAVLDAGCTSPIRVSLPGGDLTIEVDDDLHVHMTGPACEVFTGDVDLDRIVAAQPTEEAVVS